MKKLINCKKFLANRLTKLLILKIKLILLSKYCWVKLKSMYFSLFSPFTDKYLVYLLSGMFFQFTYFINWASFLRKPSIHFIAKMSKYFVRNVCVHSSSWAGYIQAVKYSSPLHHTTTYWKKSRFGFEVDSWVIDFSMGLS